ncbi:WD40-repeat-containing domain protein [Limtongia smithiae]|uniref:WD40-repeat-containing domain protein n=1 Tax=Limtongia smithiae TaxID=1125753 RepID=UPI0034CD5F00
MGRAGLTVDNEYEPKTAWDSKTFGQPLSLHLERPVSAMSIAPSGRDVVLASRQGLFIADLDNPWKLPRFLHHLTLWEVADVQWCPHAAKPTWVISTSNQKAMVWNLALPSNNAIEYVLHAHTRAITDINFHAHDPERIATCAVDAYVHCWDMRTPAKPVQSFCGWRASATSVKWNRRNSHVVASSHDRYVHIWDDRMGAKALRTITAHSSKIYNIDFNRSSETKLMTCSLDKTVKYWDYSNNEDEPVKIIRTDFPVWRARHTPFGDGCIINPQRGGKNGLYLVRNDDRVHDAPMQPVADFIGHKEPVKEFLWRIRGGEGVDDDREFQLVTWSKDHDLKLWNVDEGTLRAVGHIRGAPLKSANQVRYPPYKSYLPERNEEDGIRSDGLSSFYVWESKNNKAESLVRYPSESQVDMTKLQRTHMTRRGKQQEKISHLRWLSGVRIGPSAFARPDETTEFSNRGAVPENLGEEVSLVGNKFPKVTFERIDVGKGEIVVALNGPWGDDNALVFIRMEAKFPIDYPLAKTAPEIMVEHTKDLSNSDVREIESHVQKIATIMTERGNFCLEACLRFIMGERVPLDDLMNEAKKAVDDGYSSSDDELVVPSSGLELVL